MHMVVLRCIWSCSDAYYSGLDRCLDAYGQLDRCSDVYYQLDWSSAAYGSIR